MANTNDNESAACDTENDSNDGNTQSEVESTDEEEQESRHKLKKKKKQAKRECRANMEQKIDTLSMTLKVMQEMMAENGLIREKNSGSSKKMVSNSDNDSETTIYQAAVPKLNEDEANLVGKMQLQVDPEITFNVHNVNKDKHESSSSDYNRIDTSDELMEIKDKTILNLLQNVRLRLRRTAFHLDQKGELMKVSR